MTTEYTPQFPSNLYASTKSFFQRGGFVNGLNPTIVGRIWYAHGQNGSDSSSGLSPSAPFSTIARALTFLNHGDILVLSGVFKEQVVAPLKYDVTVIGGANRPRQATNGGVATGGGASWLAPASPTATTPLIRVIAQGWNFINIQFAPVAASACITFDRRETAAIPDSSHGVVSGCYFTTGGAAGHGVELIEVKNVLIENCIFEALTGAGGHAIKSTAGLGIANTQNGIIRGNKFLQNANDIYVAGDRYLVEGNKFYSTNPITAGNRVNFLGGTDTAVLDNSFKDVAADVTIAKGYVPGTTGQWRNWTSNTNVPIVTVPA
jgi:hypothetical protein